MDTRQALVVEILYKYALGLSLLTKADFPQSHLLLKTTIRQ